MAALVGDYYEDEIIEEIIEDDEEYVDENGLVDFASIKASLLAERQTQKDERLKKNREMFEATVAARRQSFDIEEIIEIDEDGEEIVVGGTAEANVGVHAGNSPSKASTATSVDTTVHKNGGKTTTNATTKKDQSVRPLTIQTNTFTTPKKTAGGGAKGSDEEFLNSVQNSLLAEFAVLQQSSKAESKRRSSATNRGSGIFSFSVGGGGRRMSSITVGSGLGDETPGAGAGTFSGRDGTALQKFRESMLSVMSIETEYEEQVIERWFGRDEIPDDLEGACRALIPIVYGEGDDEDDYVDAEAMIRRTPLLELYKYLKQHIDYMDIQREFAEMDGNNKNPDPAATKEKKQTSVKELFQQKSTAVNSNKHVKEQQQKDDATKQQQQKKQDTSLDTSMNQSMSEIISEEIIDDPDAVAAVLAAAGGDTTIDNGDGTTRSTSITRVIPGKKTSITKKSNNDDSEEEEEEEYEEVYVVEYVVEVEGDE